MSIRDLEDWFDANMSDDVISRTQSKLLPELGSVLRDYSYEDLSEHDYEDE